MKTKQQTRRTFLKSTATTVGLTALSASRVLGANERVNVGIIGYGLIGKIHTSSFKEQADVEIRGVSDCFSPRMDECAGTIGTRCARFGDFRRMLESKDIDAVVVATPDHWHALMTIMACAAGKDVYVEKPLSLCISEGQLMWAIAGYTKRVVQVGTQNRSGPNFQRARDAVRSGKIGDIVAIQNTFMRNVSPGFGNPPDGNPPPGMDYDMFLGPAPKKPYNSNRSIYHFRWFWDFSGGQMTNLGQHSLDLVQFFLDAGAPKSVYSTGGRFFLKDNCEVPDTQDAIIEYGKFNAVCQYREASAGRKGLGMGGLTFHGTKGSLATARSGYEIIADQKINPTNAVAKVIPGGHPVGGPQPVEEGPEEFWTTPEKDETGDAARDYRLHARNFLDCIKSRKTPIADLKSSHQVAIACHLANISLKTGRKVTWDHEKHQIVGDPEANAMLMRPYRAPWDEVLAAHSRV